MLFLLMLVTLFFSVRPFELFAAILAFCLVCVLGVLRQCRLCIKTPKLLATVLTLRAVLFPLVLFGVLDTKRRSQYSQPGWRSSRCC